MGSRLGQGDKFPIATFKVTEKVSDSPKLPKTLGQFERLTERDVDNKNKPIPIGISMKLMRPQFLLGACLQSLWIALETAAHVNESGVPWTSSFLHPSYPYLPPFSYCHQTYPYLCPFFLQDYKGLFLYHCHNLEHEDLGMMRQFYIS
jgi:hypothetical protein